MYVEDGEYAHPVGETQVFEYLLWAEECPFIFPLLEPLPSFGCNQSSFR